MMSVMVPECLSVQGDSEKPKWRHRGHSSALQGMWDLRCHVRQESTDDSAFRERTNPTMISTCQSVSSCFFGEIIPGDFISTQLMAGPFQWSSVDLLYFLPTAILFPSFLYLIYGFTGDKVVPGASDNLSGCAVAAAVGKYFSEHRLNHVEIIVGSMGSEECGDRGARDFVNRHGDLLKNAYAYCVEEASTGNTFQFIEKDFHTKGMFYSPEVLDRMEKAAARHARDYPDAYPFMRRRLSFGSSDSCQYLVAGYKASFVISIEKPEGSATKITAKPPNWHSMRDSWERTNDKTLRDSIGMAMEFCMLVDEEQL